MDDAVALDAVKRRMEFYQIWPIIASETKVTHFIDPMVLWYHVDL